MFLDILPPATVSQGISSEIKQQYISVGSQLTKRRVYLHISQTTDNVQYDCGNTNQLKLILVIYLFIVVKTI
jgi:hypothetical protein